MKSSDHNSEQNSLPFGERSQQRAKTQEQREKTRDFFARMPQSSPASAPGGKRRSKILAAIERFDSLMAIGESHRATKTRLEHYFSFEAEPSVIARRENQPEERVFEHIPSHLDIHHYRRLLGKASGSKKKRMTWWQ